MTLFYLHLYLDKQFFRRRKSLGPWKPCIKHGSLWISRSHTFSFSFHVSSAPECLWSTPESTVMMAEGEGRCRGGGDARRENDGPSVVVSYLLDLLSFDDGVITTDFLRPQIPIIESASMFVTVAVHRTK